MMGQTRQQQHHLLGFPFLLAAFPHSQALLVLATGGLDHRPAIILICDLRRRQVAPRGHQHGVLIAPLLFGGPDDVLPSGATEAPGAQDGGDLALFTGRGPPWAHLLAQLPHSSLVPDVGDHLRAPAQDPIAHSRCAAAPLQADDEALPDLPRPAPLRFQLDQRGFQGRYGSGFAPPQGLVPNFPLGTGRHSQGFPPRFAPVASPPSALAACGLRVNRHGGHIGIHPQPLLMERVAGGASIALEIVVRDALQLCHILRRTRVQGASNARLVGTALPPKGPLDSLIDFNRDVTLGNCLRPQSIPNSPSSSFSVGQYLTAFWAMLTGS